MQPASRVVVDPELLRVHRSRKVRKTHHGATAGGSSSSSNAGDHDLPSAAPFCVKFPFKPKQLQRDWEASLHRPAALGDASTITSTSDWTLEVDAPGPVWKSANQNGTHPAGSEEPAPGATPAQTKEKQGSTFSGPQHAAKEYECLLLWDEEQKAYVLRPQLSTFNLKLEQGKNTISDVGRAVLARQPVGVPSNAKQQAKRPAAGADRVGSPASSHIMRLTARKPAAAAIGSPGRASPSNMFGGGSPKMESASLVSTKTVTVKRTTVSSGQQEGASSPTQRPAFQMRMKKTPSKSSPNKASPTSAPARSPSPALPPQSTSTMTTSSSAASVRTQVDSARLSPAPVADRISPSSPLSEPTSSWASSQKDVRQRASLIPPPASLPVQTPQSNTENVDDGKVPGQEARNGTGQRLESGAIAYADVNEQEEYDDFEGELEAMLDAKLDEPPTPLEKPRGELSWAVPAGLAASVRQAPSPPPFDELPMTNATDSTNGAEAAGTITKAAFGVRYDPKMFSPPTTRRKSQLGVLVSNLPTHAASSNSGGERVGRSGVTAIQSIGGASHRRTEEDGLSDSD